MLVALLDFKTGGHHYNYASYLVRHLFTSGYGVLYITSDKTEDVAKLENEYPDLAVSYTGVRYDEKAAGNAIAKYYRLARLHFRAARSLYEAFRIVSKQKADIVQIMYLNGLELPLFLWQVLRRRAPWLLLGILVKPVYIDSGERLGLLARLYRYLTTEAIKKMLEKGTLRTVFVLTENLRSSLIKLFKWRDGNQERIVVAPDPVELPDAGCSKEEARSRIGLPAGVPVLLFFGLLLKNKGIDILMEAVKGIDRDFRLMIAGKPDYFSIEDIEKFRSRLDDPTKIITRLEHIPDSEVPIYFRAADAVVLPYRAGSSGTSGVLQLAAAALRPVVATDAGEIGEIVRQNRLGIVVAPDSPEAMRDGIEEFLERPEAWVEKTAPSAREYARKNHWKIFASAIEARYRTH